MFYSVLKEHVINKFCSNTLKIMGTKNVPMYSFYHYCCFLQNEKTCLYYFSFYLIKKSVLFFKNHSSNRRCQLHLFETKFYRFSVYSQ